MGRALHIAMIACLAGCYQSPSLASCKYRCGGANNDACPSGYTCNAGMCVAPGEGCDGDGGVIDAPLDDAPVMVCSNPLAFTWESAPAITAPDVVKSVVVADVNHDTIADLATIEGDATVAVYLGNGDGTFDGRSETTISSARRVVPGDWDHDAVTDDLLVLGGTATLYLLASNGDGSFTPRTYTHPAAALVLDVASLGDADGDNVNDAAILYTTASSGNRVQALQQANSGTVTFTTLGGAQMTSNVGVAMVAGDIDDDEHVDVYVIATAAGGAQQLVRHPGQTSGLGGQVAINVNAGPADAVIGRLHSTGYRSAVTANTMANTISIRRWSQNNTWGGSASDIDVGAAPVAVILANIGGDDLPEVVTADQTANQLSILLNNDGVFTASTLPVTAPRDVASADFDGDGRQDLVVTSAGSATIRIFLNKCPG